MWKTDLSNKFTIHGLWPNFGSNPTPPAPKKGNEFTKDWIDVYFVFVGGRDRQFARNQAVLQFWTHEWKEHDVFSDFSTVDYFKKTETLFEELRDIYDFFRGTWVLTQKLGVTPYLKCLLNSKKEELLFEIHITYRQGDLVKLPHSRSQPKAHNCTSPTVGFSV
ncbi:hypothetical protein MKX01_015596 [Papaver californicum]|nr:hypothetical protein MKX01_015596 [Papaver californicum]